MRRFICDQLQDEAGERANLSYWAFWAGDFAEQQTCDSFIGTGRRDWRARVFV